MAALAERVVETTFAAYDALPKHGKPAVRSNGVPEWTILASISLTIPPDLKPATETAEGATIEPHIQLISLGTGVKVLPAARLPPLGDTVHDCHAEVLARRGFRRWLLSEAIRLARGEAHSGVLVRTGEVFALAPGVEVWLYVSALPCGDASTLYTAAHQPADMAEAFRLAPELTETGEGAVRGRAGYERLGSIRSKPGRQDSPPSISLSCSDKIASWNILGLQGGLLSKEFAPIYIDHIVIGGVETPPGTGHGEWRSTIKAEAQRSLHGRLESIANIPAPFALHKPEVTLTSSEFSFSKSAVLAATRANEASTSNVSLSYIPSFGKPEVLINGCVNASSWKAPGTVPVKDKVRSRLCKLETLRAYLELRQMLGRQQEDATYHALKQQAEGYQAAKKAIRGTPGGLVPEWVKGLPHEFSTTVGGPFAGWIVSGRKFESFMADGTLRPEVE